MDFSKLSFNWRAINSHWGKNVDAMCEKHQITHADRMVLLTIKVLKHPTKSDVAKAINVCPEALTRSLNRLIKRDYIVKSKSEQDRRYAHFELTAASKPVVDDLKKNNRDLWRQAAAGLSEKDMAVFTTHLEKMVANLEGLPE